MGLITRSQLFRSKAFKGLLEKVLGHAPVVASRRQVRRFRPGLDYTLATPGAPWEWKNRGASGGGSVAEGSGGSGDRNDGAERRNGGEEEKEAEGKGKVEEKEEFMVLDAVLCFVDDREPYKEAAWRQDEVGGYVTYLGGDEDDDDDNVNSGDGSNKEVGGSSTGRGGGTAGSAAADEGASSGSASGGADAQKIDAAVYKADEGGTLISVSAASNALSLVLRDDPGISSFVKYVSSAAPGSRFDVVGEFLVACTEDDDDENGGDVVDSSSSEGSFGVPGGVLETVPEGESGEEEEDEAEAEAEGERSRKKMKASNLVPA